MTSPRKGLKVPGVSNRTRVISLRLPVEVLSVIERRLEKRVANPQTISKYLRNRIVYDTLRKH